MRLGNRPIRGLLYLVIPVVLASIPARASMLIYYVDVFGNGAGGTTIATTTAPGSTTEIGGGVSATVLIPKLNQLSAPPGELYMLTNVGLSLTWKSAGTVQIFNLSNQDIPFENATANVAMNLSLGGTTVAAPGVAGPTSGTALPGLNTFSGLTGGGTAGNPAANLSAFEALSGGLVGIVGDVTNLAQSFSGSVVPGNPPDLFFGGNSQTGGILKVTYTYDTVKAPIPEPASLVLMSSSFLVLGLLLRKQKQSKLA